MRIVSLLSVLVFVLGSCNSQKSAIGTSIEMKDIEIQYEANTRGFYNKLVLKSATISSTNDRDGKENPIVQKISDADWISLSYEINKVDLENLSNLKAPTEKRFLTSTLTRPAAASMSSVSPTYKLRPDRE